MGGDEVGGLCWKGKGRRAKGKKYERAKGRTGGHDSTFEGLGNGFFMKGRAGQGRDGRGQERGKSG
jgi:hypothetical protein